MMGALITSYLIPSAGIYTILDNLVKSFTKDAGAVSNGVMILLFLVGIILFAKAIMGSRSGQPVGRYFGFGAVAWLISGIMYGHFKSMHSSITSHAGGAADDALNGKG